jgi:hypothetical protein
MATQVLDVGGLSNLRTGERLQVWRAGPPVMALARDQDCSI